MRVGYSHRVQISPSSSCEADTLSISYAPTIHGSAKKKSKVAASAKAPAPAPVPDLHQ